MLSADTEGKPPEGPPRLGHIPALDGIRAIAVLLVLGYHARLPGLSGGRAGVDVFFVLSGFLITCLLLGERSATGHIALGAFYVRRALRLYPALVAAILLAIALAAIRMPVFHASSAALVHTLQASPFSLFYTMNVARAGQWAPNGYLGHTWSLAIEEQFYLVWPLVVIATLRNGRRPAVLGWIALACALTSAGLRAGLDVAGFSSEMLYNATFSHVDGIFAGCALAVVWTLRSDVLAKVTHPLLTASAVTISTVIVIRGEHMNVYGFPIIVLTTLILLTQVVSAPTGGLSAALSTPALTAIGRRSYGLYLYHWPIFLFLGIDTRPHVLVLGFGASFAVAWLSYAIVERPFLARKARWGSSSPPVRGRDRPSTDANEGEHAPA